MYYQMFQMNIIPLLLYYAIAALLGSQTLFLALWPYTKFWKSNMTETDNQIYKWLKAILIFLKTPYDTKQGFVKEIVFTGLNIFSIIIVSLNLAYYRAHRNFQKFMLIPIQPYNLCALVGFLPSAYVIGEDYTKIVAGEADGYCIASLLLAIINIIYEFVFHIIAMYMFGKSVFITNMPFTAFDPLMNFLMVMISTIIMILTFIFTYFADWAYLVMAAVTIIIFIYLFHHTMHIFYITHLSNIILFAVTLTNICCSIFMFVAYFFPKMNHIIPYIFLLCCYGFFSFIGLVVFHFYRKKIIEQLSVSEDAMPEDRKQYFDSLKIKRSDKRALMYLTIGFKFACPLFTDFSLIEYLFDDNCSTYLLSHLAQIANFFPSESNIINRMLNSLMTRRNLKIGDRYLIYQIYKIKILRQYSASSAESTSKLNDLKNVSRQVELITRSALEAHELKPSYYEELAHRSKRANAIWKEALNEFPNNAKFCEEYSRYLIEAESDYPEAVYSKFRSNMIELGKNFSVDYSLRSMLQMFPVYIKKNLVDLNGNLLTKKRMKRGESVKSIVDENSDNSRDNKSEEIDDEVLENIAKTTFSQAKSRIALHNALKNKIPYSIHLLVPVTILILTIFVVLFSQVKVKKQTLSMGLLDSISKTRFYLALNDMEILMRYAVDRGHYGKYQTLMLQLENNCSEHGKVLDVKEDYLYQSFFNLQNALNQYDIMMNDIADFAIEGYNVYNLSKNLIRTKHEIYTCYGGFPVYILNETVSTIITVLMAHQSYIITRIKTNISDMFNLHQFCELITNLRTFYTVVPSIFQDFCNFQIDEGENLQKSFRYILYSVPVVVTILAFVPILSCHFLINKSLKEISEIIMSFDSKTKNEAKEPICYDASSEENQSFSEIKVGSNKSFWMILLVCFVAFLFVSIVVAMTMLSYNANKHIVDLNKWDQFATLRLSLTAEVMNTQTFGVAQFDNPNSTNVSSPTMAYGMVKVLVEELVRVNNELLQGTDNSPACSGFDDELDKQNFIDDEIDDENQLDIHEIYSHS